MNKQKDEQKDISNKKWTSIYVECHRSQKKTALLFLDSELMSDSKSDASLYSSVSFLNPVAFYFGDHSVLIIKVSGNK